MTGAARLLRATLLAPVIVAAGAMAAIWVLSLGDGVRLEAVGTLGAAIYLVGTAGGVLLGIPAALVVPRPLLPVAGLILGPVAGYGLIALLSGGLGDFSGGLTAAFALFGFLDAWVARGLAEKEKGPAE